MMIAAPKLANLCPLEGLLLVATSNMEAGQDLLNTR